MLGKYAAGLALFLYSCAAAMAQGKNNLVLSESQSINSFPLFTQIKAASFSIDNNDARVVQLAAEAFVKDVQLVSGKQIQLNTSPVINDEFAVVAGTIGQCVLLDDLIAKKKITVDGIKGGWEQFSITVINQPYQKAKKLLVVAGSDRRGTAFGIFHLSRLMGVSPFVWWADVTPAKRKQLFVSGSYISAPPSVQYRGIFINDED